MPYDTYLLFVANAADIVIVRGEILYEDKRWRNIRSGETLDADKFELCYAK